MKVLILDDSPQRHQGFAQQLAGADITNTFSVDEFKKALALGPYDLVFLDHDLGAGVGDDGNVTMAPTGMDAVRELVATPSSLWPKQVVVHSWNPSEAPRMVQALRAVGIPTIQKPFGLK